MNASNWRPGLDVAQQCCASGNDLDCALICAIAAGDESALEKLHSRYSYRIESFTLRITRRGDLAEELAQETLTAVWQSAARFQIS